MRPINIPVREFEILEPNSEIKHRTDRNHPPLSEQYPTSKDLKLHLLKQLETDYVSHKRFKKMLNTFVAIGILLIGTVTGLSFSSQPTRPISAPEASLANSATASFTVTSSPKQIIVSPRVR